MSSIYINLPVANLVASTAFYEALGCTKNTDFSDTHASCMVRNEHIYIMLLTHDFIKQFIPTGKTIANAHTTTQMLNALSVDTPSQVDSIYEQAIAAGGKPTIATQDHGFMYGRDFEDLDGHIWEIFWMQAPH